MDKLPPKAQMIQEWLTSRGLDSQVILLPRTAHTASEAAAALDCDLSQIAKSIFFVTAATEQLFLVIASGANHISESLISQYLNEPVTQAPADLVEKTTGFPIGGIPPVAHTVFYPTIFDPDLLSQDLVWAAAGHPHTLFSISPAKLLTASLAAVTPIH